jgi:hypothetical protein
MQDHLLARVKIRCDLRKNDRANAGRRFFCHPTRQGSRPVAL